MLCFAHFVRNNKLMDFVDGSEHVVNQTANNDSCVKYSRLLEVKNLSMRPPIMIHLSRIQRMIAIMNLTLEWNLSHKKTLLHSTFIMLNVSDLVDPLKLVVV